MPMTRLLATTSRARRFDRQDFFRWGHRNIAHLTHEDFITQRGEISGTPHSLRLATYELAMRAAGRSPRIRIIRCEAGEDSACAAAREVLLGAERPTAIFAGHDISSRSG